MGSSKNTISDSETLYFLPGRIVRQYQDMYKYVDEVRNPEPGTIVLWSDNRGKFFKYKIVDEPPQYDGYVVTPVDGTSPNEWLVLERYPFEGK